MINHVYQPTISLAYGVTNQFSVAADLPYFHAHRRSPESAHGPEPDVRHRGFGFPAT